MPRFSKEVSYNLGKEDNLTESHAFPKHFEWKENLVGYLYVIEIFPAMPWQFRPTATNRPIGAKTSDNLGNIFLRNTLRKEFESVIYLEHNKS